MSKNYIYVNTALLLENLIAEIKLADWIALDTEADSLYHYHAKVCLIQISFNAKHYIVDPLSAVDIKPLIDILSGKNLILHASDYDLRMLRLCYGFELKGKLFDTMLAAKILGIKHLGLASLVEKYCRVVLSKEGQKSDWSRRPLSEKQLNYAINDTFFLFEIMNSQQKELDSKGRVDWHVQLCSQVISTSKVDKEVDENKVWRIKGYKELSDRQLNLLKHLWFWRDEEASLADKPAFKIINNKDLLRFIVDFKFNKKRVFIPKQFNGRRKDKLLKALENALNTAQSDWPETVIAKRTCKESICSKKMGFLKEKCLSVSISLNIEPSLLVSKAVLEAIVINGYKTRSDLINKENLMPWQADLIWPFLNEMNSR